MLKNILNLEGVQTLNKNQQKEVFGGSPAYPCDQPCWRWDWELNTMVDCRPASCH